MLHIITSVYSEIHPNCHQEEFHPSPAHILKQKVHLWPYSFLQLSGVLLDDVLLLLREDSEPEGSLEIPRTPLEAQLHPRQRFCSRHSDLSWSQNVHGNHFSQIKNYIWKRNAGRTNECICREFWLLGNHITFQSFQRSKCFWPFCSKGSKAKRQEVMVWCKGDQK